MKVAEHDSDWRSKMYGGRWWVLHALTKDLIGMCNKRLKHDISKGWGPMMEGVPGCLNCKSLLDGSWKRSYERDV